ncbi:MAG: CDP-alcohol phosphatidyltransferase family protein [Bacteroidaceae bacterium]|nr:CDP-alcohol phosphatidyltransferase family protein [Bacteroidaceae bacterium]MDY6099988.1 CDP-alcohol phosphatidyltransferase family protein [Bacteroidaceae bacterium]
MTFNKKGIEASYKSMDTEEFLDIHFNRPIGYLWALFFQRLDVHPNVVTILSFFLGIGAGVMFYYPDLLHSIIGIGLLMWANHFDSCDGQLARLTGKKTLWGRMLDGLAGDVWFVAIYMALCLRLQDDAMPLGLCGGVEWGWRIWLLGAVAGLLCHTRQCALADYYRNIHLFYLKGNEGSELDNSRQQRENFRRLPWKGNVWWKLFLFFYGRYTHGQERVTPAFQRLHAWVKQQYGDRIPQAFRDDFRRYSLPLMKYTNILTFNTRAIVLYLSVLAAVPYVYFLFELTVLTAIYCYMHYRHERMCTVLYHRYAAL